MKPLETIDMSKYQAAIQHPQTVFTDPDLASKRVFRNSLGWPAAQSGNFAIVYRMVGRDRITSKEEVTAVRCFKKLPEDLAQRYQQICNALDSVAPKSKHLLRTRYLANGILIDGEWKPVSTLPWVEGVSLDRHFDLVHENPREMEKVCVQLREIGRELHAAGVAHCDLQHRNILIDQTGTIRLIDYDGMFVPALTGQRTNELGHPDYQHKDRDDGAIFGPSLDRFPLISIYLQTHAISRHPELWAAKERTEGLLLRRDDYVDPDASATLAALRAHADLREMVDLFRRLCVGSLGDVPTLPDFLDAVGLASDRAPVQVPVGRTNAGAIQAPALPAPNTAPTLYMPVIRADSAELAAHSGDEVMVVGKYDRSEVGRDAAGRKSVSLYFQTVGAGTFMVLVEGRTVAQFAALGDSWTVKKGKWLSATGLLVRGGDLYVIDVDQLAQLERFDEVQAYLRINVRRWSSGRRGGGAGGLVPAAGTPIVTAAPVALAPAATDRPPQSPSRGLTFKDFQELGKLFGRGERKQK